jgi:hypothetical protein
MRIGKFGAGIAAATLALACGDDGDGRGQLQVRVQAEASISEGLMVGDDENSRDYGVTFTKYLVAIGKVKLGRSGQAERRDDRVFVADMLNVGEQGVDLGALSDLPSGRWEQLGYETPITPAGAIPVAGVTQADLQVMIDKQLTYWIEGTVNRPEKPVSFSLQVGVPSSFGDCQTDARPGVAIPEGARASVSLTLHGDHLFFDGFLSGTEAAVVRRAQWLVDADVDGDGRVVTSDLVALPAERLFGGYNLGSAPFPINDALDFVRAQLATQGHVNGEGECTWTVQ